MHTLVIGYGNRLRSDDGVGPILADAVASWQLADVQTLAVQQLLPELAETISQAERVLFVDACIESFADPFRLQRLTAQLTHPSLGHHSSPADLLALSQALYGRSAAAWLLTISAVSLDFGERLAEPTQQRMQAALTWIRGWLQQSVSVK